MPATDSPYTPFEPFSAWAGLTFGDAEWEGARRALDRARRCSSPDDRARILHTYVRLAALGDDAAGGDGGAGLGAPALAPAWKAALRGTTLRELIDAELGALTLVRQAATNLVPVTERWLKRVHVEVCRPQSSLAILTTSGWRDAALRRGCYKRLTNRGHQPDGRRFAFAAAIDTPSEMRRLVGQLHSGHFARAHPVLQAAYSHYGVVRVHPFEDGNGRVARTLASVYLYRATELPLVITPASRSDYLARLCAANRGDRAAFVDFLVQRSVTTMRFVAEHLEADRAACPRSSAADYAP